MAGHDNQNDFEFLELVNVSDQTVELAQAQFTRTSVGPNTVGVDFDFSSGTITTLMPGERVLVVEDLAAFQFRYGTDYPVVGQWNGGLGNGGELITLMTGLTVIQQFSYDDTWYPTTGGDGFSLEIEDGFSY